MNRKIILVLATLLLAVVIGTYLLGAYTSTDTIGDPSKAAMIRIEHLKIMLNNFKSDCGRYPSTSEGLKVLFEKPQQMDCKAYKAGGYLENSGDARALGDFFYRSDSKGYEVRSKDCSECFYSSAP